MHRCERENLQECFSFIFHLPSNRQACYCYKTILMLGPTAEVIHCWFQNGLWTELSHRPPRWLETPAPYLFFLSQSTPSTPSTSALENMLMVTPLHGYSTWFEYCTWVWQNAYRWENNPSKNKHSLITHPMQFTVSHYSEHCNAVSDRRTALERALNKATESELK